MILARYGPFFLYAYTVVLGLGLLAALGVSAALARAWAGEHNDDWLDGALAAAAGAFIGGRILFVWLHRDYFAENPGESWQLWLGGLSYHGALFGGMVGLALWARVTGRPLGRYAGLLAPGLALLTVSGWLACGVQGCAYGRPPGSELPAALRILAGYQADDLGVFATRYRTQLAGALGSLVVFALSLAAFRRTRPGVLFWTVLGGLSLVRAVVALGRGDAVPMVAGWRLDLLVDGTLTALSFIAIAWVHARRRAKAAH